MSFLVQMTLFTAHWRGPEQEICCKEQEVEMMLLKYIYVPCLQQQDSVPHLCKVLKKGNEKRQIKGNKGPKVPYSDGTDEKAEQLNNDDVRKFRSSTQKKANYLLVYSVYRKIRCLQVS